MTKYLMIPVLILALASGGAAQQVTSSVVGTVVDSTGSLIPGARITLIQEETAAVRSAAADSQGGFAFHAIAPGNYTLRVEHAGFKKYEKLRLAVPPNERLSVGAIPLDIGEVSEVISVMAQGAAVQTASAERSGLVSSSQIENLTVVNRNFVALVTLLPGIVSNSTSESAGTGGATAFNTQGMRQTGNNVSLDGQPIMDLGAAVNTVDFTSMDSVREVKIMVSAYQAEFGRKPGASVQAVTKSGTRTFHGLGWLYKRHEQFNANEYFNNRNSVPEARYRHTIAGFNLGGPLYIPGKFNRNRDKLFFFFSEEQFREQRPQPIRQVNMPTEAELRGDFSRSRDLNGALYAVKDPLNGQAFPGSTIPASRINKLTQGFISLLPRPNFFNDALSAGRYNFQFQESLNAPKHNELARVDYSVGQKATIYGRFNNWWEEITGANPGSGSANWG